MKSRRNYRRDVPSYSALDGDERNMKFQPENLSENVGINGRIILKVS
jgi:hypothetical protein